ncbi:DUF1109 domain-containing protein [Paraburkholderia sp.]|uniref:DUF1109 domain-containing protein n=1 Tax=Paraburkholderia sp. TaxID=1926495 RepID=UPI003D6E6F36
MKTQDLVSRLADNLSPVERGVVEKRFSHALVIGMTASAGLLALLYGVRGDMPNPLAMPLFWAKLAFPLAVVAGALKLAGRLARPGARAAFAWTAVAAPVLAVWIASALIIWATPHGYRLQLMLGSTWRSCTLSIMLLSLPTFATVMYAMKSLAPTRLVLAGASVGMLAGAQAALVYAFYCMEMAVPFWGIWYALAMLATTAAGALLGPKLLRW